jgi:hypothetical protein
MDGGPGADLLIGGGGADDFVVDARFVRQVDEFADFRPEEGDRLILVGFDFQSLDGARDRLSVSGGMLRVRLSPDDERWRPVAKLGRGRTYSLDALFGRDRVSVAFEARF